MVATACPSCAAPVPLSLASPEVLRCAQCGHEGPTPPDIRERLVHAQQVLDGLDVSQRQLDARRQRAVMGSDAGIVVFLIGSLFLLMFSPLYLCGGLVGLWNGDGEAVAFGCSCSMMTLTLLMAVPWTVVRMIGDRRTLLDACAAVPPEVEGAPARCHVCGAPLEATTSAIVRCGHCDADNAISKAALARATERKVEDVTQIETAIVESATSTGAARGFTNVWTLVGVIWMVNVLMAPVSVFVAWLLTDALGR